MKDSRSKEDLLEEISALKNEIQRLKSNKNFDLIQSQDETFPVLSHHSNTDSKTSYLPEYGDITKLNTDRTILGNVGSEVLSNIMHDFLDLLQTSGAIYEKNGDYAAGIFSSNWCKRLDELSFYNTKSENLHDALISGRWHCHESCWKDCSKKIIDTGKPIDIRCNGGIRLYGVPIISDNKIIGSINFGYGNPPTDPVILKEISEKYQIDELSLKKWAQEYTARPKKIIELAKARLRRSAEIIGIIVHQQKTQKLLFDTIAISEENRLIFSQLLQNSPVYVFVKDAEIRAIHLSANYEKMLGMPIENILGKTMDEIFPSDLAKSMIEDDKKILHQNKVIEIEESLNDRYYNTIKFPIQIEGKPTYLAGFTIDITDRKRAELELKEVIRNFEKVNQDLNDANYQLKKAKEKAEESDRLKTAFLQNMSHEIRTPMNAIMGFSEMLNRSDIDFKKRKNFTSIITNSGNQLLSIVNNILTISAIDTKQEKVSMQPTSVNDVILELHSIFKAQSMHRTVAIYTHRGLHDEDAIISTDRTKLIQILSNLLSNAVKFTHQGTIEFGYKRIKNELEFFVKDTGIGIKKSTIDHIFERFTQGDSSIGQKYGGTGLGLSISKGLVELLGGKIRVESTYQKGSIFFFTLPYLPIQQTSQQNNITTEKNAAIPAIVVAEDEEYNFILIEELLKGLNIKILHAINGEEAVKLSLSDQNVKLVLMDIKLPILDGYSVTKQIKEVKPDLVIIAQTAYALESDIEKFGKNTFDAYLTKPLNAAKLVTLLKTYLPI